jgi:DNA-binding transcriptional LysR family regulator
MTLDLSRLVVFAAVAEASSFTVAAKKLGVPRSTVSRAIAALEADVGTPLLHRTTRTVGLSPAGKVLLERTAPGLTSLQQALSSPLSSDDEPQGTLKMTATPDFAAAILADVVAGFMLRHPQVKVQLELTNRLVDLRGEGFDLAFRFAFGRLVGASLVARKLASLDVRFYASPSYIARVGAPKRLAELTNHSMIGIKPRDRWQVTNGEDTHVVDVAPRVFLDDMGTARALVRGGAGIAMLPSFMTRDDVAAGNIVCVLPSWSSVLATAFMVFPGKVLSRRVSLFRDHVTAALEGRL